MSEQQTLTLSLPVQKHYGNWVRHSQVEDASGRLALWFVQGGFLWLTSEEIAGKSHFIRALADENPHAALLTCSSSPMSSVQQLKLWLEQCEFSAYWMLDLPTGKLPLSMGLAVFHLIERAREMNRSLLIGWRCVEKDMRPPELSSRLLMMERVDMASPQSDESLKLVLESVLQTMQWDMKDTVLPTLLQHMPRNLPDFLAAIERLDAYSREKRVKMNGTLALKVLGIYD